MKWVSYLNPVPYPRDGEDIDTLIIHADAAMYKSKKSGRGRYFFFASLNTISLEKFELEQRMPTAINDKEFVLYYQPKLRLEDYRVVGLEALIRWQHPDHHLIYPADFIEIAEETGLIVDLDAWVLETACRQMTQWAADGLNPVPISINVSPIELKDRAYSHRFLKVLERYGLSTESIEIEITENTSIEDREMVISNLETLFSKGVKITLDDFGKGFSNLDHIRSLPITSLKIDRSFIKDIFNSENECPIVTSTISLAQKLEMTVVAEGIETHGQLINLKVAGCDEGQGYFFSRPVSEKKIREFIMSPIRGI
ncbi:MAG: GGDEF domain-containing phosphodiesterase [Thermodesulfobacteriota bacterium]|nr:GGDEF domain-containing phosphodiesterase [Thermodesulfobacteriota bacterium]